MAGIEFLKSRTQFDPKQIGLIGHSEGGMIAPMAAVKSKDVAFIVLMAGLSLPGDEALLQQIALMGKANGESGEDMKSEETKIVGLIYSLTVQ